MKDTIEAKAKKLVEALTQLSETDQSGYLPSNTNRDFKPAKSPHDSTPLVQSLAALHQGIVTADDSGGLDVSFNEGDCDDYEDQAKKFFAAASGSFGPGVHVQPPELEPVGDGRWRYLVGVTTESSEWFGYADWNKAVQARYTKAFKRAGIKARR